MAEKASEFDRPAFAETATTVKRPLRERVWFWKPQWHWHGWATLLPVFRGGDEWDWHTIGFGWTVTGRVIVATRRCTQTGRCAPDRNDGYELAPDWPADPYAEYVKRIKRALRPHPPRRRA